MKKSQLNKIKKMKDYLEKIFESGKIPKGYSPYEIQTAYGELARIYNCGMGETISEGVKKLFEKFKFTVDAEGIGWKIIA